MNAQEFFQMILPYCQGSLVTIELFFITIILSLPLGFIINLLYISKNKFVSSVTGGYILIMRGTPLLLQMYFIYFGLPYIPHIGEHIVLGRFAAAAVAFTLNYAAYFAEIFRGGLKAIDGGQYEAAQVLGLNKFQTMRKIILPQVTRIVLPSVGNEAIILVKDTALVTALAQPDLLHVTKGIVNKTASVTPFIIAAVFYLVMSYLLTVLFKKLEDKYSFD